jgi:hypothetical protein
MLLNKRSSKWAVKNTVNNRNGGVCDSGDSPQLTKRLLVIVLLDCFHPTQILRFQLLHS